MTRTVLVAMAVLGSGCGDGTETETGPGGSAGLPDGTAASFEGIYAISAWTEDPAGCAGGGMDMLATSMDKHFVLVGFEQLGASVLKLMSCVDAPDCQSKADGVRNMMGASFLVGADLSQHVSDDELRGFSATSGYEENGMCVMRRYDDHHLTRAGDAVTLETETKALADRAPEDGFCTVQPAQAQQEAAAAPCTSLRVLEGALVVGI